ncbi:alpha/beta hydrolase [Microbacterium foliorum]
MTTENPTRNALLVHGAWHGGWSWGEVADALRERGVSVTIVDQLPSTTGDPALGLAADARFVRDILDRATDPVTLVGHSYGGMVLSELAGHPNVASAVYVAAFLPPAGASVLDLVGGVLPDWIEVDEAGHFCAVAASDAARVMADGYDDPTQVAAHTGRLVAQSVLAFAQPSSTPGWGDTPVSYLLAEQDAAIPPFAQEAMTAAAGVDPIRLDSGHIPMQSQPTAVVDLIVAAGALRPATDPGIVA